jgi:hypothetical protein
LKKRTRKLWLSWRILLPEHRLAEAPARKQAVPFLEKRDPKNFFHRVVSVAFPAPQAITDASRADRHADARSDRLRPSLPRDRRVSARRNE